MIMALLFGNTFLLLGIFALLWNEKRRKLADMACKWPVTNAHICESRVQYARPKMDESDCLTFFYKYDVDGVSHMSKSIDLFEFETRIAVEEMEKIVQDYPQGSRVKVHYDPRDPAVSVIAPGHRLAYFRNRNLGAFLTLIGISVLSAAGFA